jgi:hypothetical protein
LWTWESLGKKKTWFSHFLGLIILIFLKINYKKISQLRCFGQPRCGNRLENSQLTKFVRTEQQVIFQFLETSFYFNSKKEPV